MKIIRRSLLDGAREARGTVVIIDVFRAFSCAPLFFYFGAEELILEADADKAVALKRRNPRFVLAGEIEEVPIPGGDLGNSPSQIMMKGKPFFTGKTVIHRTTAGVLGVSLAIAEADEIILGSFVMAGAIATYIKRNGPGLVTLVAMGERALSRAPEDEACADYLEHLLCGTDFDPVQAFRATVFQATAQKFLCGSKPYLPREDPVFCLQRDLFDFVLVVERAGEVLKAERRRAAG